MRWPGLIEKYRAFLPVGDATPVVTLHEGNTPLIYANRISEIMGESVFLKYEGLNPTSSFKDRGMTLALSKAKESGARVVICASTGNTSASAAAYAARAGIRCVVLIPEGAIALGKLSQALIHGANVISLKGNFDEALCLVREISDKYPVTLVNSVNPYRIEGQKTGAFEICDQMDGQAPDYQAIPVGNAGNITAYWKGYKEYFEKKKIASRPVMLGFQAEGAAPIVKNKIVAHPKTIATAIKIGNPASWSMAVAAKEESCGIIGSVSDKEILEAYKILSQKEGVFVEPASAAGVAGILKLKKQGYFEKAKKNKRQKSRIVCILTGHGLKDPDRALACVKLSKPVPARMDKILKVMGF